MSLPSIQINNPQPAPQFDDLEIPQYEEEISAAVDREIKDKVDELERQIKQIKRTASLGSVNFNNLCIHLV